MKKYLKLLTRGLVITLTLTLLAGCMAIKIENYQDESPKLNFAEYFSGTLKGYGIIQDWRGNVVSRFDVDMNGTWEGNEGTLEEEFRFYSGKTQHRTWKITKDAKGNFVGRADDIIGQAEGSVVGNSANWSYSMDLDVDGSNYRIKFDDWMWLMNDGVVVNRSYFKKFGFTVAELTLFIQKK